MKLNGLLVILLVAAFSLTSCGDDADYKSGMYWMTERDNWQAAAQSFERSLKNSPGRWKTHIALIEAVSRGDDVARMEYRIRETLSLFPDSARSLTLSSAAVKLLGERKYSEISGKLELEGIEEKILSKGEKPELLSRAVIASCRAKDSNSVSIYLARLLDATKGSLPDSVRYELNFFIGSAKLDMIELQAVLAANPSDGAARLKLTSAAMLSWDFTRAKNEVTKVFKESPDALKNEETARQFAALWDIAPFKSKIVTSGSEGAYSKDGSSLYFKRDLGRASEPDPYFFKNSGGGDAHLMKAAQQGMKEISLPRPSLNGDWLYFYSSNDRNWKPTGVGRFNLYRVKTTYGSNPVKLTDDDLIFAEPYFEADGSVLLVRRDVGSVRQSAEVFRLDPSAKNSTSVVRIGEPVRWSTFTPGGDTLLFITDRGFFSRALTGGTVQFERSGHELSFLTISKDSKWLLAQGPKGEQFLIDRNSGKSIYIGIAEEPMGYFSSGGKLLVSRKNSNGKVLIEYDLNSPTEVFASLSAKITSK